MQAHNRLTLRIFFFLWVIVSVSVSAELPQPYKQLISKYNFKKDSYSFVVKNLTAPEKKAIIYNGSKNFNPASLTKIITSFIALDELGPNYKWKSDFYYTGQLKGDTLHGDLIFVGKGDASFSIDNLEFLIREIQKKGIKNNMYIQKNKSIYTFIEFLFALYFLFGMVSAFTVSQKGDFGLFPFHLMLFLGFGFVFFKSLSSKV